MARDPVQTEASIPLESTVPPGASIPPLARRLATALLPGALLLNLVCLVFSIEFGLCAGGSGLPVAECVGEGAVALGHMVALAGAAGAGLAVALVVPFARGADLGLLGRVPLWVLLPAPLVFVLPRLVFLAPLAPPAGAKPDVIVLVVDTLRADRVDPERCPNLSRLMAKGLVFEDSLAAGPWTLPSMGSLLTGLKPHEHGLGRQGNRDSQQGSFNPGVPKLAQALREAGYTTAALTTNLLLQPETGVGEGFAHFRNLTGAKGRFFMSHGLGERDLYAAAPLQVSRARAWLRWGDGHGEPLFLLLHLMDPHHPYQAPERLLQAERAAYPKQSAVAMAYGAEVRWADEALGALFEELEASGRLDGAIVAFTADHGEELDERRYRDKASRQLPRHGHSVYPETLRVPLALHLPGGLGAGQRCDGLRTTADLPVTLLALLGLAPLEGAAGLPLVDETGRCLPGHATLTQSSSLHGPPRYGLRQGGLGLLLEAGAPEPLAFDRRADPTFRAPLGKAPDAQALELRRFVEVVDATQSVGAQTRFDDDQAKMLEDLGYLEAER